MRNAIILHGLPDKHEYYSEKYPSASNSHWIPWLQKHLLMNNIKADTPELFKVYEPNYERFVKEIERYDITPETTLVGHSMGAGFWVRYLSENPQVVVDKVILVAPGINLGHNYDTDLFDFEIDPSIVVHSNNFVLFVSDNDSKIIQNSVNVLIEKLPNITVTEFHDYGHFTMKAMNTNAFPELLEAIL